MVRDLNISFLKANILRRISNFDNQLGIEDIFCYIAKISSMFVVIINNFQRVVTDSHV